jgi:16S rRNA G966 N2-methylase RsmD
MTATVIHADVISALADVPDCTFDAVLCDPPYGLGTREPTVPELIAYLQGETLDTGGDFMGKRWTVPSVPLWREVFRVLKPGAPVIAFGGTRTVWLINLGLCAAGFESRDLFAWLFGSGFPKSLDVSKALDAAAGAERTDRVGRYQPPNGKPWNLTSDEARSEVGAVGHADRSASLDRFAPATPLASQWSGYGTALKPSYEPAVLARRPLDGTVAANVERWGVGALAIDASRIGTSDDCARPPSIVMDTPAAMGKGLAMGGRGHSAGRWPANVILDAEAGAALDAQSGDRPSASNDKPTGGGKIFGNGDGSPQFVNGNPYRGETGGASRFMYCAKASRAERELGMEGMPLRSAADMTGSVEGQARLDSPRTGAGRTSGARNHHPTVKPVDLMRYLARLIMPPSPGRILVPFAGSGSEMIGALLAGWTDVTGIEREAEYVAIARARVALAVANPRAFEAETERAAKADARQMDLFGGAP